MRRAVPLHHPGRCRQRAHAPHPCEGEAGHARRSWLQMWPGDPGRDDIASLMLNKTNRTSRSAEPNVLLRSTSSRTSSAASFARWRWTSRSVLPDVRRPAEYMDGSAAVIGEMMLPILEPPDLAAATPPARALGEAFQLTNFLRDIAEDLDRQRKYVPQEDLARFGVDLAERRCTPEFVALMRFEIERCRELYRHAEEGIAMLPGRSARCVAAAHDLYGRILDRIEAAGLRRVRPPGPGADAGEARRRGATRAALMAPPVAASAAAATAAGMIAFPLAARAAATPRRVDLERRRRRAGGDDGSRRRRSAVGRGRAGARRRRSSSRRRPRSSARHVDGCRSVATATPAGCARRSPGCRRSSRRRGGRWPCRPARSPTPRSVPRSSPWRRIALGAVALTAWDLFLDPQMTAEGYWRWDRGAATGASRCRTTRGGWSPAPP